jgi:homoserine kinase
MTTASAPASSANLGPGFDVAALAIGLRCEVTAEPSVDWVVRSAGEPASEATWAMVRAIAGDEGPFEIDIESDIPPTRGLGSSAALLVATYAALSGHADAERAFHAARVVEGHPDNVAAAAHGGFVLVGPEGTIHRGAIHPSLHVVLAIPDEELATSAARAVLPDQIDRELAIRSTSRMALLVEGLRTADADALRAALGDELHEGPRRALTDLPASLIEAAMGSGAVYAAWSGAGPSVIALVQERELDDVAAALDFVLAGDGATLELEIDREGVRIE